MDPITLATVTLSVLSPYLAKIGEVAAEKIGASLPEQAGKLWDVLAQKFTGKPAAEEAMQDLVKHPTDADTQAAFRKELKKAMSENAEFMQALEKLVERAKLEADQQNKINGNNNVAINVGGNVSGAIVVGDNNRIDSKGS